jgi:hypothetical protein
MKLEELENIKDNGGDFVVVGNGSLALRCKAVDRLLGNLSFYEKHEDGRLEPCKDGGNPNKNYALPRWLFDRFNSYNTEK